MSLKTTLLNLIVIGLIPVLPHLGYTPLFSYGLILILVVWGALKYQGEGFKDLGFSFKNFPKKALWVGPLSAVLILGFMQLIFFPVLEQFIVFEEVELGLYDFIKENPTQLIFMIIMGWIVGGFYEEIVFHGFIFTRLENMLSGPVSFVLAVLIFGAYHYQLGMAGMINATLVGIVYLGLYVYFKRNLWYSILCHGVYNTLVMIMIYKGLL